jgi:protein-tyrosine phosphatase
VSSRFAVQRVKAQADRAAYFIYKYGFSAQEVIGFMRIVRPGMVVGIQQQYMLLNQMKWAQWVSQLATRR